MAALLVYWSLLLRVPPTASAGSGGEADAAEAERREQVKVGRRCGGMGVMDLAGMGWDGRGGVEMR